MRIDGSDAPPDAEASAERSAAVPKLALWHLLLWTACVGLVAACNRGAMRAVDGSWALNLQQTAAALTYYVTAGLAVAGLALAAQCTLSQRRYYPVSAGHWLLTAGGIAVVLGEIGNGVTGSWQRTSGGANQIDNVRLVFACTFALMAASQLAAAWLTRDTWPWRGVLLGFAAPSLFWSIGGALWAFGDQATAHRWDRIGMQFQWPWQWLMLAVVLGLAGWDVYRRRRRDWLHWTGIAYIAASVSSQSLVIFLHGLVQRWAAAAASGGSGW